MRKAWLLLAFAAWVAGDEGHDVPRDVRTKRFATAVSCAACHAEKHDSGALRDAQGRTVAPYDLWRGSMKANAARDPFFLAAVAAEVAARPDQRVAIEAKCLHCHAPMASIEERLKGRPGLALADLHRNDDDDDDDRAALARDGVSCTLCHQILEEGAGFDGRFKIGEARRIFGPHDNQLAIPMHRVSQYWPVVGRHILDSKQCATCHTSHVNGVAELAPYFEWRNSEFHDTKSCQDCHVPTTSVGGAPLRTRISSTSHGGDILALEPREPVGRHLFVGGNTLIPQILRDNAHALNVRAPRKAFDATIAATRDQLRERTARIEIEQANPGAGSLYIVISVENLTGHKFPTGHASRRAWLRLKVWDKAGKLIFVSGATDAEGRIVGADGKPLPTELAGGGVAPHRDQIESPNQVPIWEAVLKDEKGPTYLTLGARGFAKDNRLLPRGWSPEHEDAKKTAPVGTKEDDNFAPGADRVAYVVPFTEGEEHFIVEAVLLYQTLSARYAAELFKVDVPEVQRFRKFYEAADRTPEEVARSRLVGGPQ